MGYELREKPSWDGLYTYELAIYDNEDPFGKENTWLRFNPDTGIWAIQNSSGDEIRSSATNKLLYISDDNESLQSFEGTWLNEAHGRFVTPDDAIINIWKGENGGSSSGIVNRKETHLLDGGKMLTVDSPADIVFSGNTEEILFLSDGVFQSVNIADCSEVEFKASGEVCADGIAGGFVMQFVSDHSSGSNLVSMTAFGEQSDYFSMRPSEDGVIIKGNNLNTVSLQVSDGSNEKAIILDTVSSSTEISVRENEIIVCEDPDSDGRYDDPVERIPIAGKNISETVVSVEDQIYNGEEVEPKPVVTDGTYILFRISFLIVFFFEMRKEGGKWA